jgi:large subunit ribosomal protein L3
MAGRMGNDRVTLKDVEIIKIDKENNRIFVKGSIPGRRGTLIEIQG